MAVAEQEEEDFPWHDSALPIVDRMAMAEGKPVLYIENLSVDGRPLPKMFLDKLRKENLLEESATDPEARKLLDKIEELKIENDELHIVPENRVPENRP